MESVSNSHNWEGLAQPCLRLGAKLSLPWDRELASARIRTLAGLVVVSMEEQERGAGQRAEALGDKAGLRKAG